jgi:hypothetical protein
MRVAGVMSGTSLDGNHVAKLLVESQKDLKRP